MDNTPIINKYKVSWKVNGEWHSKPLTPEVMNKLYNDLTEENFIFEIDETPPEYHYKKGKMNYLHGVYFQQLDLIDITNILERLKIVVLVHSSITS